MKRFLFILGFVCTLFLPWRSLASVMRVLPSTGDPWTIMVRLDTEGENVNALEAHFTFDTNAFSVSSISDGGSIVNLWVEAPTFSNTSGTIDFAGVIPGGESTADGAIVAIVIVPKETNATTSFTLISAQALLNDGRGTRAKLSVVSNPFPLVAGAVASSTIDTQAPDPFTPEIGQDQSIFNGQYFLAFSATDQRSGIDHYEVIEVSSPSSWQVAASPYLLKDQALSSDIYVRAVDKAGNFRMVEVLAEHPGSRAWGVWGGIEAFSVSIVLLLVIGIIFWIWKWRRKKPLRDSG